MFPFNGRAIQALKIVEASFNVSVFFETQLYANDLADVIERGEKINNTNAVKLDSEMKRCAKGTFRLTNEEFQALQPQDLMEAAGDADQSRRTLLGAREGRHTAGSQHLRGRLSALANGHRKEDRRR